MNEFQKVWKQLAADKKLTSADMAVLALVKAIKKDNPIEQARFYLKRSFKPISAPRKLNNGAYPYFALWSALFNVTYYKKEKPTSASQVQTILALSPEDLAKVQVLATQFQGRGYGQVNLDDIV